MSDRINLAELREQIPKLGQHGFVPYKQTMVALVEAVEAAQEYHHFFTAKPTGRGMAPDLGRMTGRLGNALARFDFGEPS